MSEFVAHLSISLQAALIICSGTVVMYVVFAVLLRLTRQRMHASSSATTTAVYVVLAAVVGRSMLGDYANLAGGLVVLATLFSLELTVGAVRKSVRVRGRTPERAVPIVVAGSIDDSECRRYGMSRADVWSRLRQAGLWSLEDVDLVILEPSGSMSVLRVGSAADPAAFTGVRRIDDAPHSHHVEPVKEENSPGDGDSAESVQQFIGEFFPNAADHDRDQSNSLGLEEGNSRPDANGYNV